MLAEIRFIDRIIAEADRVMVVEPTADFCFIGRIELGPDVQRLSEDFLAQFAVFDYQPAGLKHVRGSWNICAASAVGV